MIINDVKINNEEKTLDVCIQLTEFDIERFKTNPYTTSENMAELIYKFILEDEQCQKQRENLED